MTPKANGYIGLIVLLLTLAIMIYLMTMDNSPLLSWYGGGDKTQSSPFKQQLEQLQQQESQRVQKQKKALEDLAK